MSDTVGDIVGIPKEFRSIASDYKWVLPETHVGVEIEAERAFNIDMTTLGPWWNVVNEGSTRGVSAEMVFSHPFAGRDISRALESLKEATEKRSMPLHFSDRCSVHVHVDVRDMTPAQLYNLVLLYAVVERPLFHYCNGNREHGIYTVPLYEVADVQRGLKGINDHRQLYSVAREHGGHYNYKYLAINVGAILNYGSIEFRHHPGTDDVKRLSEWINILLSLKRAALTWDKDVDVLPTHISASKPNELMSDVFGWFGEAMVYDNLHADLMEGARVAQDILFSAGFERGKPSQNWNELPFGKYLKNIGIEAEPDVLGYVYDDDDDEEEE